MKKKLLEIEKLQFKRIPFDFDWLFGLKFALLQIHNSFHFLHYFHFIYLHFFFIHSFHFRKFSFHLNTTENWLIKMQMRHFSKEKKIKIKQQRTEIFSRDDYFRSEFILTRFSFFAFTTISQTNCNLVTLISTIMLHLIKPLLRIIKPT